MNKAFRLAKTTKGLRDIFRHVRGVIFCVKSYKLPLFYMKSGKVFWKDGIFEIKARARLKVCNWILRHVWNSQMSMKFKLSSAGHGKVGWMKLACMLSNCNVNLNKTPLRDIQTNYIKFFFFY